MMGTMTKVIGGVQSDGDDSMWLELLDPFQWRLQANLLGEEENQRLWPICAQVLKLYGKHIFYYFIIFSHLPSTYIL